MTVDSAGLGHSVNAAGGICVHYAGRRPDATAGYGGPFEIGPVPASYWTDPPNAITAERVAIWTALGAHGT